MKELTMNEYLANLKLVIAEADSESQVARDRYWLLRVYLYLVRLVQNPEMTWEQKYNRVFHPKVSAEVCSRVRLDYVDVRGRSKEGDVREFLRALQLHIPEHEWDTWLEPPNPRD